MGLLSIRSLGSPVAVGAGGTVVALFWGSCGQSCGNHVDSHVLSDGHVGDGGDGGGAGSGPEASVDLVGPLALGMER